MGLFNSNPPKILGQARLYPGSSIADPDLATWLGRYKRGVASRYKALRPDEIQTGLPSGALWVSPKIDGELWFVVVHEGEVALLSHNGRGMTGAPVVQELASLLLPRAKGRLIIAGELFAASKAGRPRVGDVSFALHSGTEADLGRLGFQAFDLVEGGDATDQAPMDDHGRRLATLERLLEGGKRARLVRSEVVNSQDQVAVRYAEWAEGGKAEGLVARAPDGRIFKIKPQFTVDAAVIGLTERADMPGQARSLLLALLRPDGHFQLLGSCGGLGDDDARRALHALLTPMAVPSDYRHASSSGELFRFVRPQVVVEVRATDVQSEESTGDPIKRMVLSYGDQGWKSLLPMPAASLLFPVLVRVRDDKKVDPTDVRVSQLAERCLVEALDAATEAQALPPSQVRRREVYTKEAKGQLAVRKLLVWETHKSALDPTFPAWVVHWTDYSAGRKDPLQREVRLAPDEATAMSIADGMVAENIKKGWVRA